MSDKEKAIKELKEVLDSLDITNKYRLNIIRAIEYLQKESASEDLERCVVEQMEADGDVDDFVRKGIDDIASKYAQLGAQWQRERMMKDALEARSIGIHPLEKTVSYEVKYPNEFPSKFKKVKVIIIKE